MLEFRPNQEEWHVDVIDSFGIPMFETKVGVIAGIGEFTFQPEDNQFFTKGELSTILYAIDFYEEKIQDGHLDWYCFRYDD